MARETPTLKAQKRDRVGTRYARRLRQSGRLPAVIYGHETDPLAISLDAKETLTMLKHGAHVLNVEIDGASAETCLIKDLQFGYLGDNVVHLDLARVDLDEIVEVKVHMNFVGQPESARKPGAVMVHDISELTVSCKVRDIPGEIRIDLTNMGDEYYAKDVKLPGNVKLVTSGDIMVARVEIMKEEVVAAPEAVATEAAAAEPEVLTARKDKDAAAPGAPGAEKGEKKE